MVNYKELQAVVDMREGAGEGRAAASSRGRQQSDLRLGPSATRATDAAFKARPCDHARHHQQPAGAQRHGAARGARPLRQGRGSLHLLDHLAEPACGAAGDERVLQCRAGKQAAGHRAGCRRRLRLQDLHLSGRDRLPVGLQAHRRAGQVEQPTAPKASSPTRMAATMSRPRPRWPSTRTTRSPA